MESVLKEILKQNNKISRIITRTAQQYPQTGTQLDLALYASIKIDKLIQKQLEKSPSHNQPNNQHTSNIHNSDPIFQAAFRNIQAFKQATSKLDSKINVMIHESCRRGRYPEKQIYQKDVNQVIAQRKESKRRIERVSPKKKKGTPQRKKRNQVQMLQQDEGQEPSKSLSDIDHSILKLTNQIVTIMHEQQQARRHRKPSLSQQDSLQMAEGIDS